MLKALAVVTLIASSTGFAQAQAARVRIGTGNTPTATLVSASPSVRARSAGRSTTNAIRVSNDYGGVVLAYMSKVDQIRASGQRVEIRGDCQSACTLYLGSGNVCVSRSARLSFHGPSSNGRPLSPDQYERWSRRMVAYYPQALRSWYMRKGRKSISSMVTLTGAELIRLGVPECR